MARKTVTEAGYYGGKFLAVGSSYEDDSEPAPEASDKGAEGAGPKKARSQPAAAKPEPDASHDDSAS
ncbi:hypothetical protein [Microvirga solisilvae]|uniref:hypothetical protein n=1 Tax=Microvirga solisilvae TaxID=2919498 RepID=UPI001FAEE3ED|nr:hypothetical protein [Microvirga solisilvae]